MPNKTTNFNPVKFTGGVAKSFVTATTQLIQEYMPFTSNMIEGISSTVFDIKDYAATNRPDRNIREGPGLIKAFANRARNASNALLSDLAKGDLNLEASRNQIGDYLSKFKKDEFDFDFGFDVEGFDFDDDSNANEFDGQDNFTAADFAEGMYESTSAMIGAVETSTKHLALMNAKSNDAMANKLIANDMVNMSRIMPMFDEVNKNIISVNNNLTSIVEYYNSTMNDFIKNTTTHFAKVDQFMDSISKRYLAEEKKENKKDKLSDKIFDGIQLNINNLLKKTIKEMDVEFFGGQTGLQSVIKTVSGLFLGDKTPQFINDMEGYMDFGSMLKMFNPMQELVKKVLPGLEQMRDLDAAIKASVGSLKEAFLAMGDETDKSVKGKIFKVLRKVIASDDKDDEDFWSSGTRYKKKDISWNTSDSIVLHDLIPDQLSEINSNMVEVGTNVKNIVEILENNTHIYENMFTSLTDFHLDSIKYYKHATKNRGLRSHYTHAETDASTFGANELTKMQDRRTRYESNKSARQKTLTDYKAAHTFVFNTETGKQELASSVARKYLGSKQRAYLTGIDAVGSDLHNALSLDEQLKNTVEIALYYGVTQTEIQAFNKTVSEFLDAVFSYKLNYKVIIDGRETEINSTNVISNGQIDARGLVNSINQIAEEYGIGFKVSGKYNVQLQNTVRELNKQRKENIKSVRKTYDESVYIQMAMRKEAERTGKPLEFEHQYTATDIQGKINGVSKTKADILKSNKSLALETIKASTTIAMMQAEAEGATEDSPRMQALKRQEEELEKSFIESNKKNEVVKEFDHGQNIVNRALSGVLNSFTGAVTLFGDEMNKAIVGADVKSAAQMAASEIQNIFFNTKLHSDEMLNGEIFNIVYDPETGKPKTYFISNTRDYENKSTNIPFGFKKAIGADGKPFGEFIAMVDSEGRTWEKFVEEFESKGYTLDIDGYRPVMRHSTGRDDAGNYIPTVESWVPAYKTGATRIDKDKIVQVHEGEMILDAALSENVRTNFKDMMNAGGYDKLRFEQQEELRKNIGASDERFIGHENEVIDAMNKAISDSNKSDANITDVQLSKESVCFIEGEKEDTIFTSMLKRLTEISINLGTVSRSTILEHINEIKNERKLGNKPLKDILLENILGTKGEDTMYSGGILSDTFNSIRDTINHLRFTYYDGKTYKGFERDENGNIIKDDDGKKIVKTYDKSTDETDAILVKIKEKAIENAEYFADNHGWDDKQKAAYVKSVSDMVDGIPGALSGAAVGSFFGLAGTALGAIGGFTFANKTTRKAVFGEIVKGPDGHHHVVGGIFGKFENKLISTAEEVKDNFVTAAKEVGHNLKLGIKSFLERVTGEKGEISENIKKIFENLENGKGIGGHLIRGIKDTVSKVANGVTDIASNAVIVGSKVIFKAVGMPFNMLSSIIGGKEYRKHKREEKFARSDAISDELIANLERYGIHDINITKGLRDALFKERSIGNPFRAIKDGFKRRYDYLSMDNENRQGKDKHIFGRGGKLDNIVTSIKRNYDYLGMENANREGKDKHFLGEGGKLDKFITTVGGFFSGGSTLQGGLQAIIAAIAAGSLFTMGHPIAALALAGSAVGDAIVKKVFGFGIASAGLKGLKAVGNAAKTGFKRLGSRVKRNFGRARGTVGAIAHTAKKRLGINDTGYYMNKLIYGDEAYQADIFNDAGFSEDEQNEFAEMSKHYDGYRGFQERLRYLQTKENLGTEEKAELERLTKFNSIFRKGLTADEQKELKELKSIKGKNRTAEQKARLAELTKKRGDFGAKYGNAKNRYAAAVNATNSNIIAMNKWQKSDSFDYSDYINSLPLSDEEKKAELRNAEITKFKKLDAINKKFGNITLEDMANPEKREAFQKFVEKTYGKKAGALDSLSGEQLMNLKMYGDPNYKSDRERQEDEYRVSIKDMFSAVKDAVTTVIPEKINAILEKLNLPITDAAKYRKKMKDEKAANVSTDFGSLTDEEGNRIEIPNVADYDNPYFRKDNQDNLAKAREIIKNPSKYSKADIKRARRILATNEYYRRNQAIIANPQIASNFTSEQKDKIARQLGEATAAYEKKLAGQSKFNSIRKLQEEAELQDDDKKEEALNAIKNLTGVEAKLTDKTTIAYASGATNIPNDQIAQLHKGEAVLDAETASTFRKGGFGLTSSLSDVFTSVKSQLGELVGVFKGDKHGSGEAKKGFLDKMKESFAGVGQKISNSVFGSGLIPINPLTGKPDIPKIVARAAALLGGLVFGIPLISKLVEKLKPILDPIFTGISSSIKTALGFSADQTWGDIIADKLPEVLDPIMKGVGTIVVDAFNISNEFWKSVGNAVFDGTNKGKADDNVVDDKSLPAYLADSQERSIQLAINRNNYINSKDVASNSKFKTSQKAVEEHFASAADSDAVISALTKYRESLIRAAEHYVYIHNWTVLSRDQTLADFLSFLTTAEKLFMEKHINDAGVSHIFERFKYVKAEPEDFINAFNNTSGIKIEYKSDKGYYEIANLEKMPKGTLQSAAVKLNKRANVLTGVSSALGIVKSKGGRLKDDAYYNTSYFDDTYTDESAGNGIGYGYTQNDPRWASMGYGRFKNGGASTMGSGGCGPTALSNVYTNLTGRNINPAQMARFAQSNGYNAQGGTSAGLFTSGARKLGLTSNAISKTGSSIGRSIRNGNNVLIAGKNGPYTKAGHIMSIRGVDRYGNAIVDDPLRRGARHIPMNSLTKGMTHAWSIGNGEGVGEDGQKYSTWEDVANEFRNVTFNRNGGAFGYHGLNVGGYSFMDGACIYNSFINAYLNSVLGNQSFKDYVNKHKWSPTSLYNNRVTSNSYNGNDGVKSYTDLASALANVTGVSVSYEDLSDPKKTGDNMNSVYNRIYQHLKSGNPILFSVNNGTSGKLSNITMSSNGTRHPQHGVTLAGIGTDANGNEFVVIDDPGRSGINQIRKLPIADFEEAVKTIDENAYIHRLLLFNRSSTKSEFNSLKNAAMHDSSAYKAFEAKYGCRPNDFASFDDYVKNYDSSAYASGVGSTGATTYGTFSYNNTTSSGNWLSDLISKLGTFASNLISGLISGDSSHLLDGVFDNNTSGSYSGGGSGGKRSTTGGSFIGTESEFNSLKNAAMHDTNAYSAFYVKYGCKPNDFASFDDYAKAHGISVTGTSIDGFVTPTSMLSEYNTLPSWAKTPPLRDITNINDYAKAISYTSMIAPLGEAGVEFPPKSRDELNRMYFRIYDDNGAPSFGRRGFHFNPNKTGGYPGDDIFNILSNSNNATVKSDANKLRDYIFSNFNSFPKSPNYYQIDENNGYSKEFLNALIQAEDALNMQLHSQYFNTLRSVAPNLDPHGYVLAGDLMGVAPNDIKKQLEGSITLDDVYNRLNRYWGSSHGSRIDRTYGMILNGYNGIPSYDNYVGYGDAGYNMRDKMHMYTDDIYMGDADHPMNVTMDSTPVTSRLDKLVELVDAALNGKPEPVSNGSNAKSVSIGNGDRRPAIKSSDSMKGITNIGQHDRLADIHNKLARRTRTSVNYNQL